MSEQADAPTADSPAGTENRPRVTRCQTCGSRIDPAEWHPVTTATDDDGAFQLYSFCSNECWNDWTAE
ncbi:DUF7576 family protein [Halobacterium bonnevillei]|uniref:Uncharacterized protein n=1 Tax=Halobacterium bonnevillei TaxID=2692200 RepID=A0A6B0SJQ6_9EURY|nr:hypothetical protein [Halobacterium bonnevillei]MXR20001.1 hypothetical protein [Halobacterium bonnevillei]